jgi:HSP20 family protein
MELATKQQSNNATTPEQTRYGATFTPRVDILENSEELLLCADLPGVRQQDLDVRFENGELTIHARCDSRQQNVNYLSCEYGVGDFYRVFTVGEAIDSDRISAELKNGVLTVYLPKSAKVKPKRINVKGT